MMAKNIAAEPALRQFIRDTYFSSGAITTIPTLKGRHVIDTAHPYIEVKRLKLKPVKRLHEPRQFLKYVLSNNHLMFPLF